MKIGHAAVLLASALALLANSCTTQEEKLPPKPKFAMVSGSPSAPPSCWLEDGELKGAGVDCAKIVLSAIEIEPRVNYEGSWDMVLQKAKDGRIDMVLGVFKTSAREEFLTFSIPYAAVPVSVCVRKGAVFPFNRWDDLKGRKGLIGIGESCGEDFDAFAKESLDVSYKPLKDCFQELVAGKADYLVVDYQTGMIAAWQCGASDSLRFLDVPVTTQYYHMAIAKTSRFLEDLPRINQRLKSMKVEDTPERLIAKYTIYWRNRVIQHSSEGIPASDAGL